MLCTLHQTRARQTIATKIAINTFCQTCFVTPETSKAVVIYQW